MQAPAYDNGETGVFTDRQGKEGDTIFLYGDHRVSSPCSLVPSLSRTRLGSEIPATTRL
jgi:hypothetical protein